MLIAGRKSSLILTRSDFIQLMDDDLVCLIGLTAFVDPLSGEDLKHRPTAISQLTMSLYLMTQCQLKLHHSVTSLAQTLDYIEVARQSANGHLFTLNRQLLKLAERKILRYISVDR